MLLSNHHIYTFVFLFVACAPAIAAETPTIPLPPADGRDAYEPAAAFGGDVFLVAWKSGHLAPGDLRKGVEYIGDIVACRLDRNGEVIDTQPFVVSSADDLQERPRIAFGDGVFLVVWQDIRNGKDWDVYASRVTPDGKVLDPDGILVSGGAHNQAIPDVAWDGRAFQIVWQDFRSGNRYEIYGARVDSTGKVLDPDGQRLASEKAPYSRINPVIASAPQDDRSLLFWLGGSGPAGASGIVAGCQLVKDGKATVKATFENADSRSTPGASTGHLPFPVSAAAGPQGFLIGWTTHVPYGRGNAPNDAHAGMIAHDGRLTRKVVLPQEKIRNELRNRRIRHPSAAWNGEAFVLAWHQEAEEGHDGNVKWPSEAVFYAAIAPDGTAGECQRIAGTPTASAIKPAVASDGAGTTLVVYEQHPEKADTPIHIGARLLKRKGER